MRRLLNRIRTSEDGQALVEFAVVLPLLVLLVMAILDFGRAYNYKNDLTSLANSAARYAEVNGCNPCGANQSINDYVKSTADSPALQNGTSPINPPGLQIIVCFPTGSGAAGQPLKVITQADYKWLPVINGVIGSVGSSTLKSSVIVRIQNKYETATPASNKYTVTTPCPS